MLKRAQRFNIYRFLNSSILFFATVLCLFLTGCINYKKNITDEIVLKDGNSHTGTILQCDSAKIRLQKIDESLLIISWADINVIQGKKFKTLWVSADLGYFKSPYFSVFRNEALTAENMGFQFKGGIALRSKKLFYIQLIVIPSKPYSVTKFGLGYQKYLSTGSYLSKNAFFAGTEFNLMNAQRNNGPQITWEPFGGVEKKLNEQLRIHFKLGLQFNLANKNNKTGVNMTIGILYVKRNFKKYYDVLNSQHRIP